MGLKGVADADRFICLSKSVPVFQIFHQYVPGEGNNGQETRVNH